MANPSSSGQNGREAQAGNQAQPGSQAQWHETCQSIGKQYRSLRDERMAVHRVQVRTAVDRWVQESVHDAREALGKEVRGEGVFSEASGRSRGVLAPVVTWEKRALETLCNVEVQLRGVLSPRLCHQVLVLVRNAVVMVSRQQLAVPRRKGALVWEVVLPSLLSLAAGVGVVRGVVWVLMVSGVAVHGNWWLLGALGVGLAFSSGMVTLRLRQYRERQVSSSLQRVRQEMSRCVEEIMAGVFFQESADVAWPREESSDLGGLLSSMECSFGCIRSEEGDVPSVAPPRRVVVVTRKTSVNV